MIKILLITITFLIKSITTEARAATFTSVVYASAEYSDLEFYKIRSSTEFGLSLPNSIFQCSTICMNEDECRSFHLEEGACVFGVDRNRTSFFDGQQIDVAEGQLIRVKGGYFFIFFRAKRSWGESINFTT